MRWPDSILLMVMLMAVIQKTDNQCDARASPPRNMRPLNADNWSMMTGPPCDVKKQTFYTSAVPTSGLYVAARALGCTYNILSIQL